MQGVLFLVYTYMNVCKQHNSIARNKGVRLHNRVEQSTVFHGARRNGLVAVVGIVYSWGIPVISCSHLLLRSTMCCLHAIMFATRPGSFAPCLNTGGAVPRVRGHSQPQALAPRSPRAPAALQPPITHCSPYPSPPSTLPIPSICPSLSYPTPDCPRFHQRLHHRHRGGWGAPVGDCHHP